MNLLTKDGEAFFFENAFNENESDQFFERLQSHIIWRQEPIKIFGKSVLQPRLTAWYGDPEKNYRYSGLLMTPQAWTSSLIEIKTRIETLAQVQFTNALLNFYRNERDSMGWHRDNEKELGPNPVIGSVSFGATRRFDFRHYNEKSLKFSVPLTHGSFLLMRGATQHNWEHSIQKSTRAIGPRINLTFRILI
jgi:alkylated DNA repair dioxygenase AlkB